MIRSSSSGFVPLYTCADWRRTCANGRTGHPTVEENKRRVRNSNSAGQATRAPLVGQVRARRAAGSRRLRQKRGDEDLGAINWQRACIGTDLCSPLGSLVDLELDLSTERGMSSPLSLSLLLLSAEDALNRRAEVVIISTLPLDSCRGPWFAVVKRGHEPCANPCGQVSGMATRGASVGSLLTFG